MDSLTYYDIYRADTEQLERHLAQLQLVGQLRAERRRLAAERGLLAPARLPRVRRRWWVRRGRRAAGPRATPSAPVGIA